ncbi:MAG: LptF/LptG family permease [Prosthecobacter sp.]|nr:LptF/LptG family permease [Prosthecobacter sp.]
MPWTSHIITRLRELQMRSRRWPYAGRITFALALIAMLLLVTQGHHLDNPADIAGYDFQNGRLVAERGAPPPSAALKVVSVLLPYLDRWMWVGGIVFISILLRQWGVTRKLVLPCWVAAASVAAWAVATDIAHQLGVMQMTELGEPLSLSAYYTKLVLLALAPLCISGLLHYYHLCGALDRYTMRTFLAPLIFCFAAFTSLWLIMDLLDNLKDFQEAQAPLGRVLLFYLGVMPFIFVSVMPASLLLSVLYTLTRMSRANEIIAMLGAGRSVLQVLTPLFVVSAVVSLLSMAANYHWAPRAEGKKEAVIRGLEGRQRDSIMQSSIMYRNPSQGRTWFIASMPFSLRDGRLRGVQVREADAHGRPTRVLHADSATWFPGGPWRFYDGREVLYVDGQPAAIRPFPQHSSGWQALDIHSYDETPWSMISHDLTPDFMGVPEIVSYLRARPDDHPSRLAPFRTHFYHRFALPWQSFALALVAAPLGIAYSRRGAVGGIAGSIFIFFALLFLNNLCLNLGKGGHLPAWLSPWIPHLLFGSLGAVLLHYRSQNKDLPRPSQLFKQSVTRIARPRNRQAAA